MNTTFATIKLFWQHAWRYKPAVVGIITFTPIVLLIQQFLPPLIVASILERLTTGAYDASNWWGSFDVQIIWYAILSATGSIPGWRVVVYLSWQLEIKVERDIQRRVFDHLLKMSTNFHANHFGGSLVSQTNKLSSAYVTMADTTIYETYTMIIAYVFTGFLLWPRSQMFVILLYSLSVLYIIAAILITRHVRALNAKRADAQNKQTGALADAITNVAAVKGFASGAPERDHYAKVTETTRLAELAQLKATLGRQNIFATITTVNAVIALIIGVVSVAVYHAEIGTTFLLLSYTSNLGQRLWEFSQHTLRNYNQALGDAREMMLILAEEPEVKDPAHPEPSLMTKGAINFDDVSFTHADAAKDDRLFKHLDLHIAPGTKIGLVGHSGSGKTTLTRLLLRFSDIDAGKITVDGQDISKVTQDDLRRAIAYVPQEPLLFHRSLRDNIAYGKPDATEDQIRDAAAKANAAEFIDKLPHGYDTEVGERGVKLSGGQRQRIAIARAILKDAPILVLDEATSALDSESERLIQQALWELMKGRTAIVIAHRLSTIQRMDRIVVLEEGKITEQGTHQELLNNKGIYANLWAHQSGGFIED